MLRITAMTFLILQLCSLNAVNPKVPIEKTLKPPVQETQGIKRLTPVLDMLARELEKMGNKISDNAVYSMEELWNDTINWNIPHKSKI